MADDTVQRLGMDTATLTGADRVVHDWIANHFGAAPLTFCRQMRWRTAWEAEVPVAGEVRTVLVRGSRGDAYTGPMTMRQEAGVHDIMERHGVPAPRVYGVIDEPLAIVMEKLPGGINSELIADPAARAKVREEFIEALVKLHAIPPRGVRRHWPAGGGHAPGVGLYPLQAVHRYRSRQAQVPRGFCRICRPLAGAQQPRGAGAGGFCHRRCGPVHVRRRPPHRADRFRGGLRGGSGGGIRRHAPAGHHRAPGGYLGPVRLLREPHGG